MQQRRPDGKPECNPPDNRIAPGAIGQCSTHEHPNEGSNLMRQEDDAEEGSGHQLSLSEILPVPANNLFVVFKRL